ARNMPGWNEEQLDEFIECEDALATKEIVMGGRSDRTRRAWDRINAGHFKQYSEFLVEAKFKEITELVDTL
ncbi:hypothetical protein ACFL1X_01885, partial [Candidatus Hydrogenedentota bacterium]